ncbi:hypothetical protein EU244_012705 [Rhodococcus qingshengii]|uniref:hypothetical protein n=1 Tax=Rhodococcus qingshengii TaxID=334542 RepID=UPI0010A6919E|nr:hypothetical protein [Rhodococcus qingshengii]THJ69961.1 hypothetical protein EU244_20090 [Rhodococcus qingshengii]
MDWFALSSRFYLDMDDAGVSEGAQMLLARACGYIANNETSGFLPFAAIKKLGLKRIPGRLEQLEKEGIAVRLCEVTEPHDCSISVLSLSHPCSIPVLSADLSVTYRCSIRGWDFPGWWKWNEPLERLVRKQKRDREKVAEKRRKERNVVRHSHDVARPHYIDTTNSYVEEGSNVSDVPAHEAPKEISFEGRCADHRTVEHPPACTACGEARRAKQDRDRQSAKARQSAEHQEFLDRLSAEVAEIHNCGLCDDRGYIGTTVCDHVPDRIEINQRGMAGIREQMGWK